MMTAKKEREITVALVIWTKGLMEAEVKHITVTARTWKEAARKATKQHKAEKAEKAA